MNILFASNYRARKEKFEDFFKQHGHIGSYVTDGMGVLEYAELYTYDIAIIDNDNLDYTAVQILKILRGDHIDLPVLVLSAQPSSHIVPLVLNAGADDCVSPDRDLFEIESRLYAIMRRSNKTSSNELTFGNLSMNLCVHTVEVDGEHIETTHKQRIILESLLMAKENIVTNDILFDRLYGSNEKDTDISTVKVFVCQLRQKLKQANADFEIKTIWKVGYQLCKFEAAVKYEADYGREVSRAVSYA